MLSVENEMPKVGIAVIITRNEMVLLGKRKVAHGNGSWAFPGGHLEFGESIEKCATREVLEEAGIKIINPRIVALTNDIHKETRKHYITIFVAADIASGSPMNMEPHKLERWEWFSWDALPEPLFLSIINLRKTGFSPTNPNTFQGTLS